MDVAFIDVGFGTCNLILTGSGSSIVIDAGKRPKEPLTALHHFSVSRIDHLIVSHWHHDHVGGATGLLRAYSKNIGTIWFPADPAFKKTEFWNALMDEVRSERIKDEQIRSLMVDGATAREIWTSKVHNADLKLVSPSLLETNCGVAVGDSNATSGVLILRVGARFLVFGGDAVLAQWQQVSKRTRVPIAAEVLAVPHHAGILWPDSWTESQIAIALDNLYSKIVQPEVAIISVATRPGTHHPREDVVAAIRRAKARVMCTQMTERCTNALEETRQLRRTTLPVIVPGRSSVTPQKNLAGKPSHVACAGSILVEFLESGATINQLASHQKFVNNLHTDTGKLPLCRP